MSHDMPFLFVFPELLAVPAIFGTNFPLADYLKRISTSTSTPIHTLADHSVE